MKRTRNRKRGAAAIEFAIVAIPMFTLIFACFEVSRLFMIESMAEKAAFESLRHVMVAGSTKAEGVAKANELLALFGTQGATVTVTPREEGVTQPEINDDTTSVAVTITIPMSQNTFLLSAFTKDITITENAETVSERYKGFYDGVSS